MSRRDEAAKHSVPRHLRVERVSTMRRETVAPHHGTPAGRCRCSTRQGKRLAVRAAQRSRTKADAPQHAHRRSSQDNFHDTETYFKAMIFRIKKTDAMQYNA